LVWCPKYRRRVLGVRAALGCAEPLERIVDEHGWQVGAKDRMPDRLHSSAVGPNDAPTVVVRALWSPSYVAAAS
jgi:REP element-mobilizing transposase RayT